MTFLFDYLRSSFFSDFSYAPLEENPLNAWLDDPSFVYCDSGKPGDLKKSMQNVLDWICDHYQLGEIAVLTHHNFRFEFSFQYTKGTFIESDFKKLSESIPYFMVGVEKENNIEPKGTVQWRYFKEPTTPSAEQPSPRRWTKRNARIAATTAFALAHVPAAWLLYRAHQQATKSGKSAELSRPRKDAS